MAADENESTIDDRYAVRIPPSVRDDLNLEPGDRLEWRVEDGRLVAINVEAGHEDATDLEPVDMGETDAVDVTERYDWS